MYQILSEGFGYTYLVLKLLFGVPFVASSPLQLASGGRPFAWKSRSIQCKVSKTTQEIHVLLTFNSLILPSLLSLNSRISFSSFLTSPSAAFCLSFATWMAFRSSTMAFL